MAFEALDDLYREVILDHFKNPRNHAPLSAFDVEQEGYNPLCGDQIKLQLQFENGRVVKIGFMGKGCSISQASASILTEEIQGKSISEIEEEIQFFKSMMQGEANVEDQDVGDLEALSGVRKFPVRIKCALLGWTTLEEALTFYQEKTKGA
ncbi:MAG: SUF system NifU family Fe-S cluster assembly protein [Deltaproteobacteria bacterium]|nr:SUF system NifU family Fe-S cluster assembly protein [Deltaproteobacteria bacterium]